MIPKVVGVLLAGGLSRRMGGGDKCLRPLGGQPMLEGVLERARPQVTTLVLNANDDPARFSAFGLPVVADVVPGHAGPLAGVLTGLEWTAANVPEAAWVASIATDTPFFPLDLVSRLLRAVESDGADLACASSGGRTHPVFGLWPVHLAGELRRAIEEEGMRKIDLWTARYRLVEVPFGCEPFDPFFNTNRPEDLARAEELLEAAPMPGGRS
ncbi:molybdenum cofactor guanylyltransferase MobA [Geminicoccaceae bacterium 1502E]|nr:molybdenum cofactor guanylyltransferase MobA [Geminicoccaceae bacterium 1502E]